MQGEHYGMLCTVRISDTAHIFYVINTVGQCHEVLPDVFLYLLLFVVTQFLNKFSCTQY